MTGLLDYLPDADALMALGAEDLGMILLTLMQQERGPDPMFTRSDFALPLWRAPIPGYPMSKKGLVIRAIAEAWHWLEVEGLILPHPEQSSGWFCLTRKGAALRSTSAIEAYRHGSLLPEGLLHPTLVANVRPMFLRGDYDVAVVQAFKLVEVRVREAAGEPDESTGQKLMRSAFRPEGGMLTDGETPAGERLALMELFSGAFGHARNPLSHRDVAIERVDAARLIALASYLLSFVDDRLALRR
jgi:uncharacterized protein (TIGR02391 family)